MGIGTPSHPIGHLLQQGQFLYFYPIFGGGMEPSKSFFEQKIGLESMRAVPGLGTDFAVGFSFSSSSSFRLLLLFLLFLPALRWLKSLLWFFLKGFFADLRQSWDGMGWFGVNLGVR